MRARLFGSAAATLVTCIAFSARAQEAATAVTFDDAVKTAVAKAPTAERARLEIARTQALSREARSAWLPTLYGNGIYTRLDADRTLPGNPPRVIAGADQLSANLTLTVPIVATQAWARWSHANDVVDVTRLSVDDTRRLVAVNAGRAYLGVVAQRRVLEVTERARDTAKAHFEFSKARFEGGVGNRLDLARAEQEYLTDEVQVQNAALGLAKAREALGVAMGSDVPVDAAEPPSLANAPALSDALAQVNTRPDVKSQQLRIDAADHVRRDGWTDYMPLLTGVFQPFYQNPPGLIQPLTGWQAQIILVVPFYDGGLRYGLRDEREALSGEARFDYEAALRQAKSDVRIAFEEVRRADEALQAAHGAADVAKRSLELANQAYQAGATSNLELIDAERRSRDAETQAAIAEDASRQARLDLLAASGNFPAAPQR